MEAIQWKLLPLLTLLASFPLFFYFQNPSKQYQKNCSLLPYQHYWITSNRIVTPHGVISGAVEIKEGKIVSIVKEEEQNGKTKLENVIDYGEAVVMPGLVDVHAHLDDPGRAEWEGFPSGTQAAAAGGITTLVDMPLNSDPSTISRETLQLKIKAAESRIYVDVGFWGGLVPENAFNASALEDLLNAGVLGLKSFMCPSGINDFPMTNASHIKEGLSVLAKYRRPLLVHAEKQLDLESDLGVEGGSNDARSYLTYLKTRPASWEEAAIRDLLTLTKDTRIGAPAEGAHLHIVHLSDSSNSLDLIKDAKSGGDSVTVETCPHYLAFSAEEIRDGDTRFKCSPPIRDAANKEKLWEALLAGHVDMLSSDHSPTLPELKLLDDGDFLRAWGGISSLQFVLPVTWSYGQKYGVTLEQLALWWSERPARLAGQELKGAIAIGNHADMVVWDPDVEFDLDDDPVYLKHSGISAQTLTHSLSLSLSLSLRANSLSLSTMARFSSVVLVLMASLLLASTRAQSPTSSPAKSPTFSPRKAAAPSPSSTPPKASPSPLSTPPSAAPSQSPAAGSPPSSPSAAPESPAIPPSSVSGPPSEAPAPSTNGAVLNRFSAAGSVAVGVFAAVLVM